MPGAKPSDLHEGWGGDRDAGDEIYEEKATVPVEYEGDIEEEEEEQEMERAGWRRAMPKCVRDRIGSVGVEEWGCKSGFECERGSGGVRVGGCRRGCTRCMVGMSVTVQTEKTWVGGYVCRGFVFCTISMIVPSVCVNMCVRAI
jgi:hypothetical protein